MGVQRRPALRIQALRQESRSDRRKRLDAAGVWKDFNDMRDLLIELMGQKIGPKVAAEIYRPEEMEHWPASRQLEEFARRVVASYNVDRFSVRESADAIRKAANWKGSEPRARALEVADGDAPGPDNSGGISPPLKVHSEAEKRPKAGDGGPILTDRAENSPALPPPGEARIHTFNGVPVVADGIDPAWAKLIQAGLSRAEQNKGKEEVKYQDIAKWVTANLLIAPESIDPGTVPCVEAVTLLEWCHQSEGNKAEFLAKFYAKGFPTAAQVEKQEGNTFTDDGRSIEQLLREWNTDANSVLPLGAD